VLRTPAILQVFAFSPCFTRLHAHTCCLRNRIQSLTRASRATILSAFSKSLYSMFIFCFQFINGRNKVSSHLSFILLSIETNKYTRHLLSLFLFHMRYVSLERAHTDSPSYKKEPHAGAAPFCVSGKARYRILRRVTFVTGWDQSDSFFCKEHRNK